MTNPISQSPADDPLRAAKEATRNRELILACRQLGTMLNAGTDILRALTIVQDQVTLPSLQEALEKARYDMSMGWPLAQSLGRNPHLFSPFFVDMVRQGENEGTLGQALHAVADYLEKEYRVAAEAALPVTTGTVSLEKGPRLSQTLYRLAIWMGTAFTLASLCWEYAVIRKSESLGMAAACAIVGLAAASWGALELRRAELKPAQQPALETSPEPTKIEENTLLQPTARVVVESSVRGETVSPHPEPEEQTPPRALPAASSEPEEEPAPPRRRDRPFIQL